MHDPAARRELLWKLHHSFGFGYRRWQSQAGVADDRVNMVAKAACAGVKAIMREDGLWKASPTTEMTPCSVDGKAEQQPRARVLQVQHSDASTCVPSCCMPEQVASDGDASSCADTEAWDVDVRRSHTRRPRRGRRAKARARRAEWDSARQGTMGEAWDSLNCPFGALLISIEEEESWQDTALLDVDWANSAADSRSEQEDSSDADDSLAAAAAAEDTLPREEPAGAPKARIVDVPPQTTAGSGDACDSGREQEDSSDADDSLAAAAAAEDTLPREEPAGAPEARIVDVPPQTTAGSGDAGDSGREQEDSSDASDSLAAAAAAEDTLPREEPAGAPEARIVDVPSRTIDGSGVSADSADSAEGAVHDLLEHEMLKGLERGVGLLPTSLLWAMVRLQEAVDAWQGMEGETDPYAALHHGIHELMPRLRRVITVVTRLQTSWDCPQLVRRQWEDMQDWLLEGDSGPGYQLTKFDELIEDMSDRASPAEEDAEWLQYELECRHCSMQEGWDQFVQTIQGVERARMRHEYREQQRARETLATQAAINARLVMSLGCRGRPF